MAIYRGSGGAGDATGDATNASLLAVAAANEAQASATSAASSATNAAASASAAATDATDAATSETNAAGSAADALTSETNAASSASDAATSATAAAASASDASDDAASAATSATNAASSASAASTSASSASTSATNASNSASAAATSATNAANSATAASTSASNAASSATLAASFTPSQTGNSGKFLTTDGSQTSWGTPTFSISDGSVTPAKLSTGSPSWDSSGNVSTTGDIRLNNGNADGAQLQLASSGYSDWNLDNYNGNFRAYYGSTEYFAINPNGIVTGTAGNLMLVRGTAVASTSGTSIGFTDIPSWVKRITLVLQRVTTSGTSQWLTQIGSGSYTTSGYESVSQATYSGSGATISQTAGFVTGYHNASTTYMSGTLRLVNISGNTWVEDHTFSFSVGGSFQGGGQISLGGTLDRIRLTTVNGTDTFTGGSINIFYE